MTIKMHHRLVHVEPHVSPGTLALRQQDMYSTAPTITQMEPHSLANTITTSITSASPSANLEELAISGCTAVISYLHDHSSTASAGTSGSCPNKAGSVYKSITLPCPILLGLHTSFPLNVATTPAIPTKPLLSSHRVRLERALVLICEDSVHVYFDQGAVFVANIPFRVRKAWPLHQGLLLEREKSPDDDENSGSNRLPTLFSLMHPLEELKIVSSVPASIHHQSPLLDPSLTSKPFADLDEIIMYVDDGRLLAEGSKSHHKGNAMIITQNIKTHTHRFYSLDDWRQDARRGDAQQRERRVSHSAGRRSSMHSAASSFKDDPVICGMDVESRASIFLLQERTMKPALYLDLCASICESSSTNVFTTVRADNRVIYWLSDEPNRSLKGYEIYRSQPKLVFSFDAACAIPVMATRSYALDVLILSHSNSLKLWTGSSQLSFVDLPSKQLFGSKRRRQSETEPVESPSSQSSKQIIRFENSACSNVNIILSDASCFRASFDFKPKSNLVRQCLFSLQELAPSDEICREFIFSYWNLMYYNEIASSTSSDATNSEWSGFLITFLNRFISCDNGWIVKNDMKFSAMPADQRLNEHSPGSSDWEWLQSSRFTKIIEPIIILPSNVGRLLGHRISKKIIKFLSNYVNVLHLTLESRLLNTLHNEGELIRLAEFLHALTCALKWSSHAEYYQRILSINQWKEQEVGVNLEESLPQEPDVFSVFSWIHQLLASKKASPNPFDQMPRHMCSHLYHRGHAICRIYDALCLSNQKAVEEMVRFGLTNLDTLPPGVAFPLLEAIRSCKAYPPAEWDVDLLKFVGRFDMVEQKSSARVFSLHSFKPETDNSISSQNPKKISQIVESAETPNTTQASAYPVDEHMLSIASAIFSKDTRILEVRRLVEVDKEPFLTIADEIPDLEEKEPIDVQNLLLRMLNKGFSSSFGQASFLYGSRGKLDLTIPLSIPPVCVRAKVGSMKTVLEFEPTLHSPDLLDWTKFHVGVSAAMSLAYHDSVSSSWITFNKSKDENGKYMLTSSHAGFLLGMGVCGHLRGFPAYDSFDYLRAKHDLTSVAFLLGLAVSHYGMGSSASNAAHLLNIHAIALLPNNSANLNVDSLTQSASIVGIGLVFSGSLVRHLCESICTEMKRNSSIDTSVDESYGLSCGFALGLICMGKMGTREAKCVESMHMKESLAQMIVPSTSCPEIRPGAIIALGLLYLKTNNSNAAKILSMPKSKHSLDFYQPETLMLMTISSNLIMWDNIQPTQSWVLSRIPIFIQQWEKCREDDAVFLEIVYYYLISGVSFSIALKFAGTHSEVATLCVLNTFDSLFSKVRFPASSFQDRLRKATLNRCVDILSTALSIINAGSGNLKLLKRFRKLHSRTDVHFGSHMACQMAIGTLFLGFGTKTFGTSNIAIASLLLSFYPKYPQTINDQSFHVQAFRHLWPLAVKQRLLVTMDVDSREIVSIPVLIKSSAFHNISLHNEENPDDDVVETQMYTPCFLPPDCKSVLVNVPQYWPHEVESSIPNTLFILRRPGSSSTKGPFIKPIQCMSSDIREMAFSKYFDSMLRMKGTSPASKHELSLLKRISERDAWDALVIYLHLIEIISLKETNVDASCTLRLLSCYHTYWSPCLMGDLFFAEVKASYEALLHQSANLKLDEWADQHQPKYLYAFLAYYGLQKHEWCEIVSWWREHHKSKLNAGILAMRYPTLPIAVLRKLT